MCGINGIIYADRSREVSHANVIEMRDSLVHRGPDESGIYVHRNVGLGHRRLSIVDLANGQQPMLSGDGSTVIVYNGEVYDHLQTRGKLIERGHSFRTTSDTETILLLYEEHGRECVQHMRGMFAFAIWDLNKEQLLLGRDRLGVKPLYFYLAQNGDLYFASEIKSILASGIKAELNFAALGDYLANHGTGDDSTLFQGIRRLPPGHTLTWSAGKIEIDRFWDLQFEPKLNGYERSTSDWVREWYELFREAVELRLMSDVPLGMFLSGGIDSSAIAAVMSQLVKEPIKTFSVGFAEREANELAYARTVAETFKTDHREITVSADEFFQALPNLIWHEDEPLGHPSSVALNFVSRLAAEHVKVVLSGEGSDESLAGYARYNKTLLNMRLGSAYRKLTPSLARDVVAAGITNLPPGIMTKKLERSFLAVAPDIESIYFDNFAVFPRSMQHRMFTAETAARVADSADPYVAMKKLFDSGNAQSPLDKMLHVDTKIYLHELLMKQDQMSMAASIESRVPFLDHKLVEFSARMPVDMKLRGRTTKFVLREAMKGLLPPEILNRGKMGFPVPVGKWFRGQFRGQIDEFILSDRTKERGIFDCEFLENLVGEHMKGANHDERLWALVNFEIWQRRFIDGEKVRIDV